LADISLPAGKGKMKLCVAASLCLLSLGGMSAASITAFSISGGVTDFTSFTYTIGDRFSTTQAIVISDLGVYSISGLAQSYQVGLWDSSGTLLSSVTVPATATSGQFIYVAVSPISLAAGQSFQIGELIDSTADWIVFAPFTSAPEITFGHGVYDFGVNPTLTNPTTDDIGADLGAVFGPNFKFTDVAVPEPSTIYLVSISFLLILRFARSGMRSRQ
jgi:hypothetical protein